MKNLSFALLLVIYYNSSFAQESSYKMSLQEAIDFAVKNQPAFQNYKVNQQISTAQKLQSTGEYLPKINGTLQLQDNPKLQVVALKFPNPITMEDENLKIQEGSTYQGNGGLNLSQTLVDATVISDIKYSKGQQKLTSLQYEQAFIDLKVNVSCAYYLALLNEERVKKAQENVMRDQKTFDDTKVKFDNQNALKTDYDRAYLDLQNSKYQFKISTDSVKTSTSNLAQLIGLPLNSSLELSESLPMEVTAESLPEYPDYSSAEKVRVELKAEEMQKTLNQLQRNKVNYGYIPTLTGLAFYGGLGLDDNNLFQKSSWYESGYIAISLNVPIFDGLQKVALAQQQKLAIVKNDNNINKIKHDINYQLQTTSVSYMNAYENVQLLKANIKLANEVMDEVNVRYKNASAAYQEVIDAENTLKETEFNYLQALYSFLIADLDWKKANGKL